LCLRKGNVSKKIQEPTCEYESKAQSKKEQVIVQLYYYIKFRGIATFHRIAFIAVTSTKTFDTYKTM